MNEIINYGIYHYAKKMDCDEENVARQILYGISRKGLSGKIGEKIAKYINSGELTGDEVDEAWSMDGFAKNSETDRIIMLFQSDPEFSELAYKDYRIKQSFDFYKLNGNFEAIWTNGAKIEESIPEKEPFPMINESLAFEFYKKDKSETDLAKLAMYIAIHSILGMKPYCKTNKQLIVNRMFGYAGGKKIVRFNNPYLKDLYIKYATRYHFKKILDELETDWHILAFAQHVRGMYVGNGAKITRDSLTEHALEMKKCNKLKTLNEAKKEAYKRAMEKYE